MKKILKLLWSNKKVRLNLIALIASALSAVGVPIAVVPNNSPAAINGVVGVIKGDTLKFEKSMIEKIEQFYFGGDSCSK